jgi:hypothetical protein
VDTGSPELQQMISDLAEEAGLYKETSDDSAPESSTEEINADDFNMQCKCPRCGFEFDPPKA